MSGFSDAFYKEMKEFYEDKIVETPKPYIRTGESCAVWFEPTEVWEIRGAELTVSPVHKAAVGLASAQEEKGVALRFPRFIRKRPDKRIEDATSS
ncbi:unnamed protein product, partial [Phaeothamnion confervicola]